ALSPVQALRLFDFYMKAARAIEDDSTIVMRLCQDPYSVLSRIQKPSKKLLASMSSASSIHSAFSKDLALCHRVASASPINDLTDSEKKWRQGISADQDEHERLRKLASDVSEMFISDGAKAETTGVEAVTLAPVLDQVQSRTLLMAMMNRISQDIMLETHLLEESAKLIQYAPLGYLNLDDLVSILNTLSSRLQGTHAQARDHLYHLSATVSHDLDAMVNNQVK
ncbi:hypothetical protein BX616_006438, partial [Lobosporangium transversale]